MEKACGLDIHKDSVFAYILDEQGKKLSEKTLRDTYSGFNSLA